MENPIAQSVGGRIIQGNSVAAGIQLHGVAIGLSAVPHAALTGEVAALILADNICRIEKKTLSDLFDVAHQLEADIRTFVRLSRETLKAYLGKKHSAAWVSAGFETSLAVPSTREGLIRLLVNLAAYLTANPAHENAGSNVTAARTTTYYTDITNALIAIAAQRTVFSTAAAARDVKGGNVSELVRDTIKDMTIRMDPMDNRWSAFGLNRPGQLVTPDVPLNVKAVLIGATSVAVKWDKAARARGYRIYKRVVGVDADFVYVDTRTDLDFAIEGLPAGATVEIAVSATNNGGESAKSAIATVVMTA